MKSNKGVGLTAFILLSALVIGISVGLFVTFSVMKNNQESQAVQWTNPASNRQNQVNYYYPKAQTAPTAAPNNPGTGGTTTMQNIQDALNGQGNQPYTPSTHQESIQNERDIINDMRK